MKTKRTFITGDQWLYYKLYCGERTADLILVETIKPLVQNLGGNNLIDKWFFIRYSDPDFHIRIRFHITDIQDIGKVVLSINEAISPYVETDIIWKVQTDTYSREIERYGEHTMELSEGLFYYESEMLLEVLDIVEDDTLYFLLVMKAVDQLLESFGYILKDKLDIATMNRRAFWQEFEGDKHLTKQLDKKYRGVKTRLIGFLSSQDEKEEYQLLDGILTGWMKKSWKDIEKVLGSLTKSAGIPKDQLISSYIHMLVNRAFRSKQRFYELVCYDFLCKYYKTISYLKPGDKKI